MYVISKNADGHVWDKSPLSEQKEQTPEFLEKYGPIFKLYCVLCGAKAYTSIGTDKISLTGDYYSGEIRHCPIPIKKKERKQLKKSIHKKQKKMKKMKRPMTRRSKNQLMVRTV